MKLNREIQPKINDFRVDWFFINANHGCWNANSTILKFLIANRQSLQFKTFGHSCFADDRHFKIKFSEYSVSKHLAQKIYDELTEIAKKENHIICDKSIYKEFVNNNILKYED